MSPGHIAREAEKRFGIKRRQVNIYLAKARKAWEEGSPNPIQLRAELDGMARHVYREALEPPRDADGELLRPVDLKAANTAIKLMAEIHGVVAPKQVNVSGSIASVVIDDPEIIRAQIRDGAAEHPDYVRALISGEPLQLEAKGRNGSGNGTAG